MHRLVVGTDEMYVAKEPALGDSRLRASNDTLHENIHSRRWPQAHRNSKWPICTATIRCLTAQTISAQWQLGLEESLIVLCKLVAGSSIEAKWQILGSRIFEFGP